MDARFGLSWRHCKMPKYKPTEQDIYDTTPCPICGEYILDEESETCGSWLCEQQWKSFKEDYDEWYMKTL